MTLYLLILNIQRNIIYRAVGENIKLYNPDSLLLCSEMKPADKIYTKKMKSLKDDTGELIGQLSIGI